MEKEVKVFSQRYSRRTAVTLSTTNYREIPVVLSHFHLCSVRSSQRAAEIHSENLEKVSFP